MPDVALDRTFDAPREDVFRAWTDPEQVAQWWGPDRFTVPRESVRVDARVGGRFDLDMVDPGGRAFPVRQEFTEVVENELLVMVHEPVPEMGLPQPITTRVEFSDAGAGTRLRLTGGPYPEHMGPGAQRGNEMQMEKLAALLA